jgi:hypothetical protein
MISGVIDMRVFCDCIICGKQFLKLSGTGSNLYWHIRREHNQDHEEAFANVGLSLENNVEYLDLSHIQGASI